MRIAAMLVTAAVLAAPQASAKTGVPGQLLAFVGSGQDVSVVKLDALTLAPVSRAAPLGIADAQFVSRVLGGGRAAFSTASAALRFLDFDRMRWEFRVAYPGRPTAALWNYADRLVTLSSQQVIVVDPTKGRLGAFRSLGGGVVQAVRLRNRLVALVAPVHDIGAAKLAVVDDRGRVRTTALPEIRAGTETVDNGAQLRFEYPALVADETRAVVLAPDGAIAEVRLDTLAVTRHALSRPLAFVRKQANGSTRIAQWVDASTIAVTGTDASFDGVVQRGAPAGLTFVDTRAWSARTLDAESIEFAPSAFGPGCITCTSPLVTYGADGVTGYAADGKVRFRMPGKTLRPVLVAGTYAYVAHDSMHFTLVDTSTGSVVKTIETKVPTSLVPHLAY